MNSDRAPRIFEAADQEQFAKLSGDFNPMHMDPVAARRTQAGAAVVHGVHLALWSFDTLAAEGRLAKPVGTFTARFHKFVYVGTPVALRVVSETASALKVEVVGGGVLAATIGVGFGAPSSEAACLGRFEDVVVGSTPVTNDFGEIARRSGRLPKLSTDQVRRIFPSAAKRLGAERAAAVAQLSALVGMICPGLHSIFGAFELNVVNERDVGSCLTFETRSVDERFRIVEIGISGSGIAGAVTAFVRQPPALQADLAKLRAHVEPGEFSGVSALVVGGSRGMGSVTAKAIVAGGGRVVITYAQGERGAQEIASELGAGVCRVLQYDARKAAAPQLAALPWGVNQLYYFATPHIARPKAGLYDANRFAEFCEFYVNGFARVCEAIRARGPEELSVFYPSSVFVDERPRDMTEYAMAKAAGEILCADMNRFTKSCRVLVKRLPRVLTDQSASVIPLETADPVEVMVPLVRELRALSDGAQGSASSNHW